MTSCAMIAGMLPMALGWGEGAEMSAPLGRAVIGGLIAATLATLCVLPAVFALVQGKAGNESASLDPDDPESPHYHEEEVDDEAVLVPGAHANGDGSPHELGTTTASRVVAEVLGLWGRLSWLTGPLVLVALAGCDAASEGKVAGSNSGAIPVARVEVVRPERRDVLRKIAQPGQVQGFETTELHSKISGYVKNWSANIGDNVKKGQVLAELSDPELDAELRQKNAALEQALAARKQAEAAVEVAEANVDAAEAKRVEVQAGVSRVEADLARWQAEFNRVEQLFNARRRPAACSTRPGTSCDRRRRRSRRSRRTSRPPRSPSFRVVLCSTRPAPTRSPLRQPSTSRRGCPPSRGA